MAMGEHYEMVMIQSPDFVMQHQWVNYTAPYDWVGGWWELSGNNSPSYLPQEDT